jgi:TatA/E family protein of Tat protein translocase
MKMFEGLFQPMHLIVILIIAMVIFGPGKIPELGSALGKAIRDFKKAMNEVNENANNTTVDITPKGMQLIQPLPMDHPIFETNSMTGTTQPGNLPINIQKTEDKEVESTAPAL